MLLGLRHDLDRAQDQDDHKRRQKQPGKIVLKYADDQGFDVHYGYPLNVFYPQYVGLFWLNCKF